MYDISFGYSTKICINQEHKSSFGGWPIIRRQYGMYRCLVKSCSYTSVDEKLTRTHWAEKHKWPEERAGELVWGDGEIPGVSDAKDTTNDQMEAPSDVKPQLAIIVGLLIDLSNQEILSSAHQRGDVGDEYDGLGTRGQRDNWRTVACLSR